MSMPLDEMPPPEVMVRFADRPVGVFPGAPGLAVEINLEEQEALKEYKASKGVNPPSSDK